MQQPEKMKTGVSVLGIRECAHQDFPRLFICGMVEGAIPRLTTRLPFTNSLENVRMGTRSLADILHEEEYYFITALLSGEKVYLSAPLAEGDKPLLTSAFFEKVKDRCNPECWKNSGVVEFSSFPKHLGHPIRRNYRGGTCLPGTRMDRYFAHHRRPCRESQYGTNLRTGYCQFLLRRYPFRRRRDSVGTTWRNTDQEGYIPRQNSRPMPSVRSGSS